MVHFARKLLIVGVARVLVGGGLLGTEGCRKDSLGSRGSVRKSERGKAQERQRAVGGREEQSGEGVHGRDFSSGEV